MLQTTCMYFIQICGAVHIVTYSSIASQRLGKHIPAQAYARNNRSSIASQRLGKHIPAQAYARNNRSSIAKQAFSTVEAVFSA
jgi:hypothetical protein